MDESYRLPASGATVTFRPGVRRTLEAHRQTAGDEAGGILLGRVYPSGSVVVEAATVPGAHDQAGPTHFVRSGDAQRTVDQAWLDSGGEQVYLGEWHSHPEPAPTPSPTDKHMIGNARRHTRMEISFLLLVIVGQQSDWVGLQTAVGLTPLVPGP